MINETDIRIDVNRGGIGCDVSVRAFHGPTFTQSTSFKHKSERIATNRAVADLRKKVDSLNEYDEALIYSHSLEVD